WARETMNNMYHATPDGYIGDEDNGQTSAWYVFSALGFYPVAPATTQYVFGAPLFKEATLHLDNGKIFVIKAPDNSDEYIYVDKMKLNGKTYKKNWIDHFDILKGGVLEVDMKDKPNKKRGASKKAAPYSMSNKN